MRPAETTAGWWHSDADIGALCREGYTTIGVECPQDVDRALTAATAHFEPRKNNAAAVPPAPVGP